MKLWKSALSLGLALIVATGSYAADKDAKAEKGKGKKAAAPSIVQLPKEVALSDEQKPKIEAINKEFAPKAAELQKKIDAVLTDDQKQARQKAMKDARDAGKKGKDAKDAIDAAIKLTDDQKKGFEDATKAMATLRGDAMKKVGEVLTAEQKEKVPALSAKKGRAKKAADKK